MKSCCNVYTNIIICYARHNTMSFMLHMNEDDVHDVIRPRAYFNQWISAIFAVNVSLETSNKTKSWLHLQWKKVRELLHVFY